MANGLDVLMGEKSDKPKTGLDALTDSQPMQIRQPTPQPTMWDTFKEGMGNLAYGAAKGIADPIFGASSLALHGINSLSGGRLQNATNKYDDIIQRVEDLYQYRTPGSIAAGFGRFAGNVAFPLGAAGVIKAGAPMAGLGNAAITGGMVGAVQPVINVNPIPSATSTLQPPDGVAPTGVPDYWMQKAAQIGVGTVAGGALSAAGTAIGGAYNTIRPLVSPSSAAGNILLKGVKAGGDQAAESAGLLGSLVRDPAAMASRLESAGQLVPGSLPNTAQVAGSVPLLMAEKALKNNPAYKVAFEDRAVANNAARMAALRQIAKTPADLEAAIAARKAVASPLYESANAETHAIDDGLAALIDRPSTQAALARGRKLAAERGETVGPIGGSPAIPERQIETGLLSVSGAPITKTAAGVDAVAPTVDGKTLQYIKMGLDDLQKEGKQQGMGAHEANALSATRNDLDGWLIQNSPTFKQANSAFAEHSLPINTMEAGQSILGSLERLGHNVSGDVAPALSQFRGQYQKALKNSPYGIDPEAKKMLDAIQSDMQRETVSNSLTKTGSDTAYNLQAPNWLGAKLYGEGMDGKSMLGRGLGGLGGLLTGGPLGAAGGVMAAQKLGSIAGNRVNEQLQAAMLDPALFAKLLREAAAREANQGGGLLGAVPVRAGAVGATDALGLLSR
jgi:hypothetical protein